MGERINIIEHLRGAALPAACIAVASYFAYHAIGGDNGLLAWGGYKAQKVELQAQVALLDQRRQALEQKIELLNPQRVDPDLADELVRGNLGVVRADEVVVQLPKAD
jgi:cell division protein FtsB